MRALESEVNGEYYGTQGAVLFSDDTPVFGGRVLDQQHGSRLKPLVGQSCLAAGSLCPFPADCINGTCQYLDAAVCD